jgi:hypothetical protein
MFEYRRMPLENGAYMDCIKCDKFRFSLICVTLSLGRLTLSEKKALYVLCTMMERSCARFPSPSEFDVATGMLYNAMISFGFSEEGDGDVLLTASADFVGGNLFGEPLMQPSLDFMCECMRSTVIDTEHFEGVFWDSIDYIRGNILGDSGDPEAYASLRYSDFSDIKLKGITSLLSFEEKQTIPETVTPADVSAIYGRLTDALAVYGFFIGVEEPQDVVSAVKARFYGFGTFTPSKKKPELSETVRVADGPLGGMTRMYMGFSHKAPRAAAVLLASYLGACPQSRLFTVLREEKRYCYSVSSYCSAPGVITVCAAVGPRTEDDARNAVLETVDEAARVIDPEVFKAAKRSAVLTAQEVFDSRSLCESCCFSAYIRRREDPFSLAEELLSVTEKDVQEAAKTLRLSLDYTCRGNGVTVSRRGYTKGEWIDG